MAPFNEQLQNGHAQPLASGGEHRKGITGRRLDVQTKQKYLQLDK